MYVVKCSLPSKVTRLDAGISRPRKPDTGEWEGEGIHTERLGGGRTFHRADTAIAFTDVDVGGCEDGEGDGFAVAAAVVRGLGCHGRKYTMDGEASML